MESLETFGLAIAITELSQVVYDTAVHSPEKHQGLCR